MTALPPSSGFKRRCCPLMVMCLFVCHLLATLLPSCVFLHLTWAPGTGISRPRWMWEEGRTCLCPIMMMFRMGQQQMLLQRLFGGR